MIVWDVSSLVRAAQKFMASVMAYVVSGTEVALDVLPVEVAQDREKGRGVGIWKLK